MKMAPMMLPAHAYPGELVPCHLRKAMAKIVFHAKWRLENLLRRDDLRVKTVVEGGLEYAEI